jgi:hypothetical protein
MRREMSDKAVTVISTATGTCLQQGEYVFSFMTKKRVYSFKGGEYSFKGG